MSDDENIRNIPSVSTLSKLGITAIGYTSGGIFLFLLQAFARFRGLGLFVGALVCIFGLVSFLSKDPSDKKAGAVIMVAGILALLSKIPVIAPFAGTLLTIGAIGLLAMGILNGIKFFIGFRKRSQ